MARRRLEETLLGALRVETPRQPTTTPRSVRRRRRDEKRRRSALKRLRQAFYLKLRQELTAEQLTAELVGQTTDYREARGSDGRLELGRKDARFWPAVGVVLDVVQATGGRVSEAAALLGVSTGNLIDFLALEPKVWEQANLMRARFGLKLLRGA